MLFDWLKKRRRWLLWLAALGLLVGWGLTWALDSPLRPVLAERDGIRAAAVHVSGMACGQFTEGSGFMAEPGLVLTNAHVVAGVEQITVSTADGESEVALLVGFDSDRDIAALLVPDAAASPVALAPVGVRASDVGDAATVDSDDGLSFVPFEVTRRILATGRDFYAQETEGRHVLEIRSLLAAGDSGAALLNFDGEVVGMVFAVARGRPDEGYALDRSEIAGFLAEIDNTPAPTPPCRTR
ncbi:trypsin-like peptidase domain-containing protein [Candidatus Poriferisocius sp.]|uniref:trypsin-like peptidase domain-containing protein n=1 Tax=Candidatus Poriferisocius sp. TaxID=3101276 RepID=UPI003B028C92